MTPTTATNEAFKKFIENEASAVEQLPLPSYWYDPVGDQLSFTFLDDNMKAQRIDELVTVYWSRSNPKVIAGAVIKRVKGYIFRNCKQILVQYGTGPLRVEYLLLVESLKKEWDATSVGALVYRELIEKARQTEAQVPATTVA